MLGAARAYQANLTAIGLIRDLVSAGARTRRRSESMAIDAASPRTVITGSACRQLGMPATPSAPAAGRRRRFGDVARRASSQPVERSSDEQANTAVGGMLDGTADVHDAMIALQRADLTLQFTRADSQQAGAGLPGNHADARLGAALHRRPDFEHRRGIPGPVQWQSRRPTSASCARRAQHRGSSSRSAPPSSPSSRSSSARPGT